MREAAKPLLSPEETYKRTKNIQQLGAECKRLLEQKIIPSIKGGEEALKQAIHILDRKIPDDEHYKTGYRYYRFGTRPFVIEYLDSIINSPDHPSYKEYQDFKLYHQKREQEIATLLEHNLPLIISRAFKYRHYFLESRELADAGAMGFINALDRYDPDRGIKLSTYAVYAIDRAIHNYYIKQISQDKTIIKEEVDDRQEIADPRSQQEFDRIFIRDELDQAIKQLPERTQEMVRLYYEKGLTFKEIGIRFNLGRERVRQIINEALAQMKIALLQLRQSNLPAKNSFDEVGDIS